MFTRVAALAALMVGIPWAGHAAPLPPAITEGPIVRILAAVYIDGRGPFHFMLDTGATQAVLTVQAARQLGLRPERGASVQVQGIAGEKVAPVVHLASLDAGALHFRDIDVPLLGGTVFEGLDGILGVQGLTGKRIWVSFLAERCVISASPAHAAAIPPAAAALHVLSERLPVVAASVGGIPIAAVVDTGAAHTLGNPALLRALQQAGSVQMLVGAPPIFDATQTHQAGGVAATPPLQLGSVALQPLTVTFADYEIFRTWGLADRPALVLGMDTLGKLAEFSIDYKRLEMQVLPRPPGPAQGTRQASIPPAPRHRS